MYMTASQGFYVLVFLVEILIFDPIIEPVNEPDFTLFNLNTCHAPLADHGTGIEYAGNRNIIFRIYAALEIGSALPGPPGDEVLSKLVDFRSDFVPVILRSLPITIQQILDAKPQGVRFRKGLKQRAMGMTDDGNDAFLPGIIVDAVFQVMAFAAVMSDRIIHDA